jgi:hypothetical protein
MATNPFQSRKKRACTEAEAAEYIGGSPSYMRKLRREDRERLKAGEDMQGPPWIEINATGKRPVIRYLYDRLDSWLESRRPK